MRPKITACCLSVVMILFISGCMTKEEKFERFQIELKSIKQTKVYAEVQKTANRDLNLWLSAGLEEVEALHNCNWKVDDAVFFNTKKDRCYLLLVMQDKDSSAELDYVNVMYGALINDHWTVYYLSFPNLVYPREYITKSRHTPIPMSTLAKLAEETLANGYYNNDGSINDAYIDGAYTPEVVARHKVFLKKIRSSE
jgi:hypothetical protein